MPATRMTTKPKPFILDKDVGSKVEFGWLNIMQWGRPEGLEAPDPFCSLTKHPNLLLSFH